MESNIFMCCLRVVLVCEKAFCPTGLRPPQRSSEEPRRDGRQRTVDGDGCRGTMMGGLKGNTTHCTTRSLLRLQPSHPGGSGWSEGRWGASGVLSNHFLFLGEGMLTRFSPRLPPPLLGPPETLPGGPLGPLPPPGLTRRFCRSMPGR